MLYNYVILAHQISMMILHLSKAVVELFV